MDLGSLATALAVVREGSVRGAARLIGRPASSVGDAFERFAGDLGLNRAGFPGGRLA